jgi:GDP-4-dehydro-6-deoxy-D-mannose reductase
MKVVVTGVNGFVGRHLVRELTSHGHAVIGVGLDSAGRDIADLMSDYVVVDLREKWPELEFDGVIHLAALSAVAPSFTDPQRYIEANSAPLTHLGEALLAKAMSGRVVVVSTGAVYGGAGNCPLNEIAPIIPSSPYIVSKILTEAQSAYYRQRGVEIIVMRPFNHVGPGQSAGFLLPDLVSGVTNWMQTGAPMNVGNLDTRRDFTDVRDVVRAYRLVLEAPHVAADVFNVCSGKSVSGRELLEAVSDTLVVDRPPDVEIDQAKLRPGDPAEIRGDNTAIRDALGWQPVIPLRQTVRDVVEFIHESSV